MRAMILAAGKSTRLGALGQALPKPLVPVCGVPALAFGLSACARAGLRDVVINLHHHAEQITREIGDGSRFGVRVQYSHEEDILGTGGGIAQAAPWLGSGPILVMNGKVVADVDLAAVMDAHRESGADATLVVRDDPAAAAWGPVGTLDDRIVSILDARAPAGGPPSALRMFTGIYVLEPSLWRRLTPVFSDSIRDLCVPALKEGRLLHAFVANGFFAENSTPARYLACNLRLLREPQLLPRPPQPLVGVDAEARVDAAARLIPPLRIEKGAVVEAGAEVGPAVVLGREARVRGGVRISDSVVWPGATVSSSLSGAVITAGDQITVTVDELVAAGAPPTSGPTNG